ncbi:MAG: amidoligase family protein, partial [Lachnospiraceae bacterium]|nr:amidoligase family protein [Lachnospiraceae bacterium]MCM1232381.1 amidoligase family protein [Ruminococcus flavefaciens]
MSGNFEGIKTQRFGVEIECTGLTREDAAEAVAMVLGGSPDYFGGSYDRYDVYDSRNRCWKIMSDASIKCTTNDGTPASKKYSVELVTPILEYEDIAVLQEVVRSIRRNGGICNNTTGIHIHIDFAPYDPQKLRNLVNIFASKEDMLYQALQVNENRENTYCQKVDKHFVEELNRKKPKDLQTIKRLWYGDDYEYHSHYDSSRYRCLNLHSVFTDNNIEIRAFNSSLNAGVLRAYISLVLAVSNQALTQKSASPRVTQSENPRYTFRCWLIRIGLNGEEFKNCRKHLLSNLEGNIAWLHPEDAIKQRERLKAERIAAREQRVEPVSEVQQ